MQLKLQIQPIQQYRPLPKDHSYILASAFYNIIKSSDKEFAEFLHQKGWTDGNKSFKFYTFSRIQNVNTKNYMIELKQESFINFHSPHHEIVQHVVMGLFQKHQLKLYGFADFEIRSVESLPDLSADITEIDCMSLSPILIHKKNEQNQKWAIYPAEAEWAQLAINNLEEKWNVLHQTDQKFKSADLSIQIDHQFLQDKKYYGNKSKIGNEGHLYRGYQFPFRLQGKNELIKFAIDTGIGENNAMGFGCIKMRD